MPLSEYEQRILEQMEEQLRSEDPDLAARVTSARPRNSKNVLLGIVAVLAGLALLVIGVASGHYWVSILGFIGAFAGIVWATSSPSGAKTSVPASSRTGRAKKSPKVNTMNKFEERWERRRDER